MNVDMSSATPARSSLPVDPIELARSRWVEEGWGSSADGMAFVTSIMRVQQVLLSRVERELRPLGLTFARFEVLMILRFSRTGSLPVGKIGERLQVHPASVTNATQRLAAAGLLERHKNPEDGRGVIATITDIGREQADLGAARLNAEVFANVPLEPADQIVVNGLLRSLRQAFGDFD